MIHVLAQRPPAPTARVYLRESEQGMVARYARLGAETLRALAPDRLDPSPGSCTRASLQRQAIARVTGLPLEVLAAEVIEVVYVADKEPLPGLRVALGELAGERPPQAVPLPHPWPLRERIARLWPERDGDTLPACGRFERLERSLILMP